MSMPLAISPLTNWPFMVSTAKATPCSRLVGLDVSADAASVLIYFLILGLRVTSSLLVTVDGYWQAVDVDKKLGKSLSGQSETSSSRACGSS